jgi:hypothetical protein
MKMATKAATWKMIKMGGSKQYSSHGAEQPAVKFGASPVPVVSNKSVTGVVWFQVTLDLSPLDPAGSHSSTSCHGGSLRFPTPQPY